MVTVYFWYKKKYRISALLRSIRIIDNSTMCTMFRISASSVQCWTVSCHQQYWSCDNVQCLGTQHLQCSAEHWTVSCYQQYQACDNVQCLGSQHIQCSAEQCLAINNIDYVMTYINPFVRKELQLGLKNKIIFNQRRRHVADLSATFLKKWHKTNGEYLRGAKVWKRFLLYLKKTNLVIQGFHVFFIILAKL